MSWLIKLTAKSPNLLISPPRGTSGQNGRSPARTAQPVGRAELSLTNHTDLGRCLNNDHRKLHPRFIVAWFMASKLQFPWRGTLLESEIKVPRFASRDI